jgi:hypothetical protein
MEVNYDLIIIISIEIFSSGIIEIKMSLIYDMHGVYNK